MRVVVRQGFYCIDRYHYCALLLLQLLMLHYDWYFVFISYHVQLRLLFLFKICSASLSFLLFLRCAINIILSINIHTYYIYILYSHYDILSDIMIILDRGNIIMCRHHFHDIIMHSFPDIEEIRFFDRWQSSFAYKIIYISYYTMLSGSRIIIDHENMCRHHDISIQNNYHYNYTTFRRSYYI